MKGVFYAKIGVIKKMVAAVFNGEKNWLRTLCIWEKEDGNFDLKHPRNWCVFLIISINSSKVNYWPKYDTKSIMLGS